MTHPLPVASIGAATVRVYHMILQDSRVFLIHPLFAESAIYLLINLLINPFKSLETYCLCGSWGYLDTILRIFGHHFAAIGHHFADIRHQTYLTR